MSIKDLYRRERRRILRTIRNYRKRGLDVLIEVPKIPKRITEASVRRLKKIDVKVIREQSYGPDLETGERLPYYAYERQERRVRREERKIRKKVKDEGNEGIPFEWQVALEHAYAIFADYEPKAQAIVYDRMNVFEKQFGERQLGIAMQRLIEEGHLVEPKQSYNIQLVIRMCNYLGAILNMDEKIMKDIQAEFDEENVFEEYDGEFLDWY